MEHIGAVLSNRERWRGFFGLYFGRIVMAVSGGLLGVFFPIFLFKLFDGNIHLVVLYYILGSAPYLFLVAFGAQFLNKFGFRKALVLASLAAALLNTAYYFTTPENMLALLPASLFALLVFRLLFWIPYHVDFAIFTQTGKRGGQVGLLLGTITLLGVIGPMAAGVLIEHFSMGILFAISIVAYVLGIIPFALVPRTNERFIWNYRETWHALFSKRNRAVIVASIAAGADDIIGVVIWPIFIFLLLDGNYFQVGALSSFIVAVTVLFQLLLGNILDKKGDKHQILKTGSILYALGWIIKIFVATAFQIFVAGIYHKVTKVVTDTSYDAIFYELTADRGHYVDELTVISEMAIQIGRISALVAVSAVALFAGLEWTFIIGAIASIAFTALSIKNPGKLPN